MNFLETIGHEQRVRSHKSDERQDNCQGGSLVNVMEVHEVSLAAPAYNEAEGLNDVISEWVTYLSAQKRLRRFEIVICDDGSTDRTPEILSSIASRYPQVRAIRLPTNQGAAAALARAISQTSLNWVLLIDSDGQYVINNLERMISAVEAHDLLGACGVRRKKIDSPFARFGSWASGAICNLIHRTTYRDFNCAFKLVSGPVVRSIILEAKGLNYSTEMTSKLAERGIQLAEVEILHRPREYGKSSVKLIRDAFHRLLFVFYIAFRQLLLKLQVLQRPGL